MKRKLFCVFLGAEALLCAALSVSSVSFSAYFSTVAAFPFEQIALGLKALSRTGSLGNGAAWALLVLLGLALLLPTLRTPRGQARPLESFLNVLLALCAVLAVWLMANPDRLTSSQWYAITEAAPGILNAGLGISVWSVAAAWVIARLLRLFRAGDTEKLLGYGAAMLRVLCALFVGAAMLSCPGTLAEAIRSRQSGADAVFALLRFLVSVLPYALDTVITFFALDFLEKDRQSGEAVASAERLSRLCCLSLLLMSLSTAGLNLLQLAVLKRLSSVNVTVTIPVLSLAFALAVLLLSRLIAENKQLADDNDLFI